MFPCTKQMVVDMASDDRKFQSGKDNNTISSGDVHKPVPLTEYDVAKGLESYFGTELSAIPDAILRKAAIEVVFPFEWDAISDRERSDAFVRHFIANYPQEWEEFDGAFNKACEIQEIEKKIEELTILRPQTVTEHLEKTKELERFQGQLEREKIIIENIAKKKPEEIVEELKSQKKEDWEIAGVLEQTLKLSTFKIGKLLPASPGANIAADSVRKRGWNLVNLYRKKTTTSNPK